MERLNLKHLHVKRKFFNSLYTFSCFACFCCIIVSEKEVILVVKRKTCRAVFCLCIDRNKLWLFFFFFFEQHNHHHHLVLLQGLLTHSSMSWKMLKSCISIRVIGYRISSFLTLLRYYPKLLKKLLLNCIQLNVPNQISTRISYLEL